MWMSFERAENHICALKLESDDNRRGPPRGKCELMAVWAPTVSPITSPIDAGLFWGVGKVIYNFNFDRRPTSPTSPVQTCTQRREPLVKLEQEPRVRLLEWRTSRWSSRWTPTPFQVTYSPRKEMWSMIFAMASWIIAIAPVYRKHMMFVHPKLRLSANCLVGLLVYCLLTWRNSVDKDSEPSSCSRQCFYLVDVDIESGVRIVFSASTIFLL